MFNDSNINFWNFLEFFEDLLILILQKSEDLFGKVMLNLFKNKLLEQRFKVRSTIKQ